MFGQVHERNNYLTRHETTQTSDNRRVALVVLVMMGNKYDSSLRKIVKFIFQNWISWKKCRFGGKNRRIGV